MLNNVPCNLNIRNPAHQRQYVEKLVYASKVQNIVAKKDEIVVHMSDEQSASPAVAVKPNTLNI